MKISTQGLGIHFNFQYLFKDLDLEFESGRSYAITGPNGIGKSTLIKLLSGFMAPTDGRVVYLFNDAEISQDKWYKELSISAPYMELIEELTLMESLKYHFGLKTPIDDFSNNDIIKELGLGYKKDIQIKYYSSGMKQRVKLALALFSNVPVVFLDEPTTNLDEKTKSWYLKTLEKVMKKRLFIIASNDPDDVSFCDENIQLN